MQHTFAYPLLGRNGSTVEAQAVRRLCELALDAVEWEWRPELSWWIDALVVLGERE